MWTWDTLSAVLDAARPHAAFPLPPPMPLHPPALALDIPEAEPERDPSSRFVWRWWRAAVPWVDESGAHVAAFPVPVAVLGDSAPSPRVLVSMTALWHLLPGVGAVGDFFNLRHGTLWQFLEGLGVSPGDVHPSKRAKAMMEKHGWEAGGPSPICSPFPRERGPLRTWVGCVG